MYYRGDAMGMGMKLPSRKKISKEKRLYVYNQPKFVYIPLVNQNDTNITVLVKKGDPVFKGTVVGRRKGAFKIPIHSSVSGTVVGFEEHFYSNGSLVKCVVIENDFKEAVEEDTPVKHRIASYSKQEFLEILQEKGIIGMGGSGFPTYLKYQTEQPLKTLIVNAVECEPYISADYKLCVLHLEEVLEAVDAIMEINQMEECLFVIKKTNFAMKELLNNYIGTYLRIHIAEVPDMYPMGWERNIILKVKNEVYETLPLEVGIVVNNVSTIYAIYEALKLGRPVTERIVTFTGEMLKVPQNVLVKIGTPIRDVIEKIGGYKRNKDMVMIAGGPMMGNALPTSDLVVSPNLNCVLVLKYVAEKPAIECLRCGKCVDACPVKLSPVLIKDHKNDAAILNSLHPSKCIGCGLCSYVCPSKIEVRRAVREANEYLKDKGGTV